MKVEEIKSIIPTDKIYQDALSPSMQQIGKALESVAKTSRFLLAPFDYLAAQHDRWQRYLTKVSEQVEDENLIEGQPQIVIPTLEGLSLTTESSLLSELFINLLANSINRTKQDLAHPAFPNLIKQLSYDEAVILYYRKRGITLAKVGKPSFGSKESLFHQVKSSIKSEDVLQFPQHYFLYILHLEGLNLIMHNIDTYWLTGFGQLFADSCIPDKFEGLQ